MKALIFFSLLVYASVTVSADCDTGAMTNCYVGFFKNYGFSEKQFPPSYEDFTTKLATVAGGSRDAINTVCKYYSSLYKCLDSKSDCITYKNMADALDGADNGTAADYVAEFFSEQYTCSDGLEGYKQLFDCKPDIDSCKSTGSDCDSRLSLYNCLDNVIKSKCNTDAAVYMCKDNVLTAKYTSACTNLPDCDSLSSGYSNTPAIMIMSLFILIKSVSSLFFC
ncbi:hypothetical protein FO519_004911 [Halicephalobus sp. NKZ332]|nr:hypothetical protein FO519_004911 [Halicephalobus sp. NKZ332]